MYDVGNDFLKLISEDSGHFQDRHLFSKRISKKEGGQGGEFQTQRQRRPIHCSPNVASTEIVTVTLSFLLLPFMDPKLGWKTSCPLLFLTSLCNISKPGLIIKTGHRGY